MPDLTIKEVADAIGISKEAVRKRLTKLPDSDKYQYLQGKTIIITEEGVNLLTTANRQPTAKVDTESPTAEVGGKSKKSGIIGNKTANRQPTFLEQMVGSLSEQYEGRIADLQAEIARQDATIEMQNATITELRKDKAFYQSRYAEIELKMQSLLVLPESTTDTNPTEEPKESPVEKPKKKGIFGIFR